MLITDSEDLAKAVEAAVERALTTLPRAEIARASWRDYGASSASAISKKPSPRGSGIAPEHLEIETQEAEALSLKVRNAGAIFLGSHTPEAIGDYVGGPNHVLPTAARPGSLRAGVLDFMKRTTVLALHAGELAGAWAGGDNARPVRGSGRPCPLGGDPAELVRLWVWRGQGAGGGQGAERLVAVSLDESSIARGNPDQEHERAIALYDILEGTASRWGGRDPTLWFSASWRTSCPSHISTADGEPVMTHLLSRTPFRRVIRDYEDDLRELLQRHPYASPSQIAGRSTWVGAACTTKPRLP